MKIYIDQSGKVEDTAKHTILACVNSEIKTIFLSAKDKRRLQEVFRRIGSPQLFVDYVFAALLILLLKPLKISKVTVDLEYPGHTKIISALVTKEIELEIDWKCIGKTSKAHDIAYKVFVGKLAIGKRSNTNEVFRVIKKITGGYLKTGLSPVNRYSAPANKRRIPNFKTKVKRNKK